MRYTFKRLLIADTVLMLITGLLYCGAIFNGFQTNWDDQWVVKNVYTISGVNTSNIHDIFFHFYHGQYAPINQIYYTIIYSVFGYDSKAFHLFSILLHIANTLLVLRIILAITNLTVDPSKGNKFRIAFLTALFFGISPIMVESVAWLSASKVVLYAFFYLLSLLSYIKYMEQRQLRYYSIALILFIFSFGAKEQAVILPLCLLFLDFIVKRSLTLEVIFYEKIPFFIISAYFAIITLLSQEASGEGLLSAEAKYPFYQNISFACYSLLQYAYKCLLPIDLNYLYPFPNLPGTLMPLWFWSYLGLFIIIVYAGYHYLQQRWILFGISFFVIHLTTVLHVIPISRHAIIADRYIYVSTIGIFFILSVILENLISKNRFFLIPATLYFFSLFVLGIKQIKVWQDSSSLKYELRQMIMERENENTNGSQNEK